MNPHGSDKSGGRLRPTPVPVAVRVLQRVPSHLLKSDRSIAIPNFRLPWSWSETERLCRLEILFDYPSFNSRVISD